MRLKYTPEYRWYETWLPTTDSCRHEIIIDVLPVSVALGERNINYRKCTILARDCMVLRRKK